MAMMLLPFSVFAQLTTNGPPEPQANAGAGAPPPPPGLPIDDHLPLLLIAGLSLGIYLLADGKSFKKVL